MFYHYYLFIFRERKKDAKREKLYKASNLPEALLKINKLNDPEQISRRTQMVLPAPQISDTELEDIAKLGDLSANYYQEFS